MVRTFVTTLAFAAALAVSPAAAQSAPDPAPRTITFSEGGVEYVYTSEARPNGSQLLVGTADGKPFRLIAGKQRVRGTVNGRVTSFTMAEVRARVAKARQQVASN